LKILITGITGFAGSHLTRYLRSFDGMEVTGLDLGARGQVDNRVGGFLLDDLSQGFRVGQVAAVDDRGFP